MCCSRMGRWGILFVLSGPSGAGKGTLREKLFKNVPDITFSISCTTRSPRQGEINGKDYRFIDRKTFKDLAEKGAFLEWAVVHGNFYGTLIEDVNSELNMGKNVVLEIDVQGAKQVMVKCPEAVTIF